VVVNDPEADCRVLAPMGGVQTADQRTGNGDRVVAVDLPADLKCDRGLAGPGGHR
jgi:hypothetical protein